MAQSGTLPATEPRAGVVEVVGLTKRFGDVQALGGVSFRLEPEHLLRPARAIRLRQDDAAADAGGLRGADFG